MMTYECHVYIYTGGALIKANHCACWAMLHDGSRAVCFTSPHGPVPVQEVYIDNFQHPDTEAHQERLLSLINQITPCGKVEVCGKSLIRYRLLERYSQNLVLLNFVRNLWHDPLKGYVKKFFAHLEDCPPGDPLEQLTWANREACGNVNYSPGHSNAHPKKALKVKKAGQLLEWDGSATGFLIS